MESASSRFNPDDLLRDSAWIAHLALHVTKSPADAKDLQQQTFLAVLEKPPAGGVLRRPWLAGVMRNLQNTRWTRDIRRERREEKVAKAAVGCTPEEALANGEIPDWVFDVAADRRADRGAGGRARVGDGGLLIGQLGAGG